MQASDVSGVKSENDDKAMRLQERLAAQLDELILLTRFQALGEDRVLYFVYLDKKIRFFLPYALKDFIQRARLRARPKTS